MIAPHPADAAEEQIGILPASEEYSWPTLPVDLERLNGYLAQCIRQGIGYGLGCKADSSGRKLTFFPPLYADIDCSGFVRAALAYATITAARPGGIALPDGSFIQHDWCANQHFKISTFSALLNSDGALRIAFIAPNPLHRIGHVYLVRNGRTMESYGGHGPGSRSPLVHVLHVFTTAVYVLTAPEAAP